MLRLVGIEHACNRMAAESQPLGRTASEVHLLSEGFGLLSQSLTVHVEHSRNFNSAGAYMLRHRAPT